MKRNQLKRIKSHQMRRIQIINIIILKMTLLNGTNVKDIRNQVIQFYYLAKLFQKKFLKETFSKNFLRITIN